MYLTGVEKPRPLTHDLIGMIFKGLNVTIMQVVINDLQDTTYFARLFLEQKIGYVRHIEIDSRQVIASHLALMIVLHVLFSRCSRKNDPSKLDKMLVLCFKSFERKF